MCEVIVIRYKGCPHLDHLPGKLHDMPIYCANLEFVETGISTRHDLCLLCRHSHKKTTNAKAGIEDRECEDSAPDKGRKWRREGKGRGDQTCEQEKSSLGSQSREKAKRGIKEAQDDYSSPSVDIGPCNYSIRFMSLSLSLSLSLPLSFMHGEGGQELQILSTTPQAQNRERNISFCTTRG